ncbi:hypothetical protein X792_04950 [Dehalococcoides mccartyi CG1]|jgi:TctA family transporter|uniref:hypothetical protein n=1 Tax=Dehalococcoides mccartyi TaxID=61435 RepID=UPI0004E094CB|nr:hypothetical protein [Dehalococcoides mccartyi]AII58083.1 hypothetical protein X792_04950 [Dehalococcoides mccartyi CG1]
MRKLNWLEWILILILLSGAVLAVGSALTAYYEDAIYNVITTSIAIVLAAIIVLIILATFINYLDKRPRLLVGVLIFVASMLIGMLVFSGLFPSGNNLSEPKWDLVLLLSGITGLTLSMAWGMYFHALEHNRRAVAWATAFAVFGPILAGIAYLLTWPKQTD